MLLVNYGSHASYQDTFVFEFLKLFPNSFITPKEIWDIIVKFWYMDLSETDVCHSCGCKRKFSQPDCNWGWDSSRDRYFFGYHLYMFVAADSKNDLPIFSILNVCYCIFYIF